jgi:hypothetical protein
VNEWQERIGVGTTNYALGRTGPTRQRTVIADEGPRKGRVAAIETDHKSGRQDAQVFVDPVRATYSISKKGFIYDA